MRYRYIFPRSPRKKLIEECKKYLREILYIKRGKTCQICGIREATGLFHVLEVGTNPRLELCEENLLLSCWHPCHFNYHHSPRKARKIELRIRELLGDDYEERLLALQELAPKMTMSYLKLKCEALRQEAERRLT